MTYIDKHIVESYAAMLENLSPSNKVALINLLEKSLKAEKKKKEKSLLKAFGSWGDDRPAEVIAREIREARKFKKRDLNF
jgi:hypothetical protein